MEKPHDGVAASQAVVYNQPVHSLYRTYNRWEVTLLTDYEIIMIFLGIINLILSSSALLIALLAYIDRL